MRSRTTSDLLSSTITIFERILRSGGRECEKETGTGSNRRFRPDPAAMPFHHSLAYRKADARARDVASMEPLENAEDPVGKLLTKAFAVVRHRDNPLRAVPL